MFCKSYQRWQLSKESEMACFVLFAADCLQKTFDIMEITEGNLHVLAGYLQKTLSPDPVERRGGLINVVDSLTHAVLMGKFSCCHVKHKNVQWLLTNMLFFISFSVSCMGSYCGC